MVYYLRMNITPGELRARHTYADRSVESALQSLSDPVVLHAIGQRAIRFSRILSSSFVANLVDGEVCIPAEHANDSEGLPIIAIRPSDKVVTSGDFSNQTNLQRANTLRVLHSWQPAASDTEATYDRVIGVNNHKSIEIDLDSSTIAMTGTQVNILDSNRHLSRLFLQPPPKGIVLFRRRPLLILKMVEGTKFITDDMLVHELVHKEQCEYEPVTTITSQKNADMTELRWELEAYHYGAMFAHRRLVKNGKLPDDIRGDQGVTQMAVSAVHLEHGVDPVAPYRPSPALLRKLQEHGLDSVLHSPIKYDKLLAMLDTMS